MSALFSLAMKDLKVLFRDRMGFVSAFVWPLVIAIFFGTFAPTGTGEETPTLEVAIADEDLSESSRALVQAIEDHPGLSRVPQDREQALAKIRKGQLAVLVVVPEGYGEQLGADQRAPIDLHIDPRRSAESSLAAGLLTQISYELRFGTGPAMSPIEIRERPVQAQVGLPPSPYAVTFPQGMIWVVISCTASFGISIVTERSEGTLLRLRVAPLRRSSVLLGKALAFLLSVAVLMSIILGIGLLVFGLKIGSPLKLVVAMTAIALGFSGLMTALAVLGKTPRGASGLAWAILMIASMTGGAMLPLFMMPGWMQTLAKVSPVNWALLSLEGAVWRGYGWSELAIPCGALLTFGLACFAIGAAHFHRKE